MISMVLRCHKALIISHPFFLDNASCLLKQQLMRLILKRYEEASRQHINFNKSELSCSQNVPNTIINELVELLNVKVVESPQKYMGLPTIVACSKT